MNVMNLATRNVITVAPSNSIDKTISLMEENGIHHLVVAVDRRPVGIVSDRDILISSGWMLAVERSVPDRDTDETTVMGPTRVEQIMSRPVVTMSPAEETRAAALLMMHRKISAIPIVGNDQLIGLLTETDLLRGLHAEALVPGPAQRLLCGPVRDVMRARVRSVEPRASLGEVIDLFRRYRVRHVPVVIDSRVLGVISDRDVRRCLGTDSMRDLQAEAEGRVGDIGPPQTAMHIMHPDVQTISAQAPLCDALRRMLELRIHSLPVVDADRLTGIITQTDFVKCIVRENLF